MYILLRLGWLCHWDAQRQKALNSDGLCYILEACANNEHSKIVKMVDGEVYAYGTEIGAFVRLDDLDQGYAFKEIDRSIFMNPDKINARLVMPVSPYKEIVKGHKVDLFLYANNYTEVKEGENSIEYFATPADAIKVFKAGARMAKGTTSEKGLVESYFANPFGPAQKKKETDILIEKYFWLIQILH